MNPFVTYEIATRLKKADYKFPSIAVYTLEAKLKYMNDGNYFFKHDSVGFTLAPLWEQAIDWLREVHQIDICSNCHYKVNGGVAGYLFDISNAFDKFKSVGVEDLNYHKAREKAILKALDLIN